MIYLVDFTTRSKSEVAKLKERVHARSYNHRWELLYYRWELLYSIIVTHCVPSYAHAIWLYVWDDSPFSGEWFEKLMSQGHVRMDNSFFVHLNKSPYMNMDQHLKRIEEKFGQFKDHARVISPDNKEQIDELCEMLLRLESK